MAGLRCANTPGATIEVQLGAQITTYGYRTTTFVTTAADDVREGFRPAEQVRPNFSVGGSPVVAASEAINAHACEGLSLTHAIAVFHFSHGAMRLLQRLGVAVGAAAAGIAVLYWLQENAAEAEEDHATPPVRASCPFFPTLLPFLADGLHLHTTRA